jgi:hypothetical protein
MRARCFLWQRLRRKKADLGDFAIGDERPDRTKLAYDSLFHISPCATLASLGARRRE